MALAASLKSTLRKHFPSKGVGSTVPWLCPHGTLLSGMHTHLEDPLHPLFFRLNSHRSLSLPSELLQTLSVPCWTPTCRLAEDTLCPIIQNTNKDAEQVWTQC